MTSSVVYYENLVTTYFSDVNTSIISGVSSRWDRKKMQVSSSCFCENEYSTDICHPLGSNNGQYYNGEDQFIPNLAGMDIEMYAHSIRVVSSLEEDGSDSSSTETDEGAISTAGKEDY